MNLRYELDAQLERAAQGRLLWLKLVEHNDLQLDDYVFLFPSGQKKESYYGLLYLNQFIEKKKANRIFVITDDEIVFQAAEHFTTNISIKFLYTSEEIDSIVDFYRLYKFTGQLIIVATNRLPGRTLSQLLGIHGITVEELIAVGVYQLRGFSKKDFNEFRKEELIVYHGQDPSLQSFFRLT